MVARYIPSFALLLCVLLGMTGGAQEDADNGPFAAAVDAAQKRVVKIYGATLTPFEGTFEGYYSAAKDEVRIEVNEWIRSSGEFDGVIDFEAATQDAANPRIMKAEYDSGDHLHPGDAGYKAMADSIDPALFQ